MENIAFGTTDLSLRLFNKGVSYKKHALQTDRQGITYPQKSSRLFCLRIVPSFGTTHVVAACDPKIRSILAHCLRSERDKINKV